ncbi:hypothetical protein GWI33_018685, partial [Rhynchophorus ferrugineus]
SKCQGPRPYAAFSFIDQADMDMENVNKYCSAISLFDESRPRSIKDIQL